MSGAYLGNPHDSWVWSVVSDELDSATSEHGPMHSGHEAVGVIEEEFLEFRSAVFWGVDQHGNPADPLTEAVQLAAMAIRYLLDVAELPPVEDYGPPPPALGVNQATVQRWAEKNLIYSATGGNVDAPNDAPEPAKPGLDVERLAAALHGNDPTGVGPTDVCGCRSEARAIAAEYARLAGGAPDRLESGE